METEAGTTANGPLRLDQATMATDDAGHRGQPNAQTGEVILVVQTLERQEQSVGVSHIETGAVIGDAEPSPAIDVADGERDFSR